MKLVEEEVDVIAEHAFENEQTLQTAVKVGLAFEKIRERIVREFIASLQRRLEAGLGKPWLLENSWSETPLLSGSYLFAYKAAWSDTGVGLFCAKNGPSGLNFSVRLEGKPKTPLVGELKEALDKRYAFGRQTRDYPWWKWVDEPYRDWRTEEAFDALVEERRSRRLFRATPAKDLQNRRPVPRQDLQQVAPQLIPSTKPAFAVSSPPRVSIVSGAPLRLGMKVSSKRPAAGLRSVNVNRRRLGFRPAPGIREEDDGRGPLQVATPPGGWRTGRADAGSQPECSGAPHRGWSSVPSRRPPMRLSL
ncbi:MAG: hypothetical protein ACM3S5_19105 [Rhodospirillales bacterium]